MPGSSTLPPTPTLPPTSDSSVDSRSTGRFHTNHTLTDAHCDSEGPRLLANLETAQVAVDHAINMDAGTGKEIDAPVLSIVVPVYNEHETLPQVIEAIEQLPVTKEIIVVDDASTDGTSDWLREQKDRPGLTVLLRRFNRGKGAALRLGFRHCRGNIVAIQDADLEYNPRDLMKVIHPICCGVSDVVYGSRYLDNPTQDGSLLHRLGNYVLTGLSNLTTGFQLTDMETCHKAFRREIIQSLPLRQCRFGFEPEVTAKLARNGNEVLEVPVAYQSRGYDQGKKINWRDGINAIYCMLRYSRWD